MKKIKEFLSDNLVFIIMIFVGLLCTAFLYFGNTLDDGYVSLTGGEVEITESTEKFIETAQESLYRLMNEDAPTDDETILNNEGEGKGFYTTLDDIISRRINDGATPYQCSRYTAYLATGTSVYSNSHLDYGPVNGKDLTEWLVRNYGFKYIDNPVPGAIGSGGFNTLYGHTAMYLWGTGTNKAMVNDANYVPLAVGTHEMDITGWKWVVPGSYTQPVEKPVENPKAPNTGIPHGAI